MAFNDPNGRRPELTKLVLLDQVQKQDAGSKIRFLGCVHEYDANQGVLRLKERFPAASADVATVSVNLDNVLTTLNHDLVEVGAWINVTGYVRLLPRPSNFARIDKHAAHLRPRTRTVDASMVWSAGAIKLADYQSAVRGYQNAMKDGRHHSGKA